MFKNRWEAGQLLAKKLMKYRKTNAVVLAIPRGGVPIGFVVSRELELPLELVLSKKIGHPTQKEYAIGAVSLQGRIVDDRSEATEQYIDSETERIRARLLEQYHWYYPSREPIGLKDKTVIIVDDGIATGNTLLSTIQLVRESLPAKIVVAVPVGPPNSIKMLRETPFIDEVVCVVTPKDFYAVGQFYDDFHQVKSEEAKALLEEANETFSSQVSWCE